MSVIQSVQAMRIGLEGAITGHDWTQVRRHIERLKSIIIDSVVRREPAAIEQAGLVLEEAGERLELAFDLPMQVDETALAWQLRADAETAALAARILPEELGRDGSAGGSGGARQRILLRLRQANGPLSNTSLSEQTGMDPAQVSRTLKRLEMDGMIRRWLGPNRQRLNAIVESSTPRFEPMENVYRPELGRVNGLAIKAVQPAPVLPDQKAGNMRKDQIDTQILRALPVR